MPLSSSSADRRVPEQLRDSNLDSKSLRNQSLSTVGLLSYPESYPSQSRAAMGPLGIGWARMTNLPANLPPAGMMLEPTRSLAQ